MSRRSQRVVELSRGALLCLQIVHATAATNATLLRNTPQWRNRSFVSCRFVVIVIIIVIIIVIEIVFVATSLFCSGQVCRALLALHSEWIGRFCDFFDCALVGLDHWLGLGNRRLLLRRMLGRSEQFRRLKETR
jgi:small-conductance mechanosensitive channel